jgi:hypothetical protein
VAQAVGVQGPSFASGRGAFWPNASMAWRTPLAAGSRAYFPPAVAIHVVRLACERPDTLGRSLSPWDGAALARQLIAAELVEDISMATGRRMLASHQLKPWRHHLWRSPKPPGTPPLMRPSLNSSSSTRAHFVMTRWSCPSTKNPLCSRGAVCLRPRLPSRGTCLPGMSTNTRVAEP